MKKTAFSKSRLLGHFALADGRQVFGDLRIRGPRSSLRLRDNSFIHVGSQRAFHGELHDLQRVSCLDCIELSSGDTWSAIGATYYSVELFPHFVTIGAKHLDPDAAVIKSVHFTVGDIAAIFYDFDAFGHLTDAGPLIESALSAKKERPVDIGDRPRVAYFTGKEEVIAVETTIGRFSVRHWISYGRHGQPGIELKSQMMVSIEPKSPVCFDDCITMTTSALRFLSLLAGRKQGVESMSLAINTGSDESDTSLSVRWSYAPRGHKQKEANPRAPHPIDIPLDAIGRPEEFSRTFANWLSRDATWRLARSRFDDCLRKGNLYDVDRLVSAANMFDLIPQEDVSTAEHLPEELAAAKTSCTTIFKALPISLGRDSVLGALSRIGKPSLSKKILHRVAIVNRELSHKFPELELVVKAAVRCRNYFVHGGTDNFDYLKLQKFVPFFTSVLEFVFVASDLIEAGWDARAWSARSYTGSHSFTGFRHQYGLSLRDLKEAMSSS